MSRSKIISLNIIRNTYIPRLPGGGLATHRSSAAAERARVEFLCHKQATRLSLHQLHASALGKLSSMREIFHILTQYKEVAVLRVVCVELNGWFPDKLLIEARRVHSSIFFGMWLATPNRDNQEFISGGTTSKIYPPPLSDLKDDHLCSLNTHLKVNDILKDLVQQRIQLLSAHWRS